MHFTYVTHSKKKIGLIMRALEAYKHAVPLNARHKVEELYDEVRAAYYYRNVGELYVRAENEKIVESKEMTLAERIKFIMGGD